MKVNIILSTALVIALTPTSFGQGFVNLNFESANVIPTAAGTFGSNVDPALAFPGWTVGVGGAGSPNFTLYNNLTLGSVAQVLVGPAYPNAIGYVPLEGSYSALLQFGPSETFGTPALVQRGVVPLDARSITFLTSPTHNDARLLLGESEIPLYSIGNGRVAGDVSGFAGAQVDLTFSTRSYNGNWLYFDDVAFSPVPVPEPLTSLLCGIGLLAVFASRHWENSGRRRRRLERGPGS